MSYHVHLPVYDDEDTCVGYIEQPVDSSLVVITEPSFADRDAAVGDAFQQSGDDTIWMS